MQCPKCETEGATRNGSGRMYCKTCRRYSMIPAVTGSHFPPPAGHGVEGVSTLHDGDGKVVAQWVKTKTDPAQREAAMRAFADELAVPLRGKASPSKAPKRELANSLSAYMIGDAHFGAYAWAAEAGADFDTDIAAADLRAAVDNLVDSAPASALGYLVDVGDYLHSDNRSNATPAGTPLDVDSRYQRVIRIAAATMRYCIDRMLTKHTGVKVFCVPGNHNPDSAGWMALLLSAYYEREPRVTVETSPSKFYYERFGANLIGMTHGDKIKMGDLPSIMAADRAKDWGETEHRFFWTGHIHHTKHQEYRGCFVESFNTLAASDAWHHASGYRSARQMQRIDVDREHGIYARGICNIGMIRGAA